ncbi:putative glutathione-specific gamma-glutamylcyclotransferase 2 [Glandiceps talaboti]
MVLWIFGFGSLIWRPDFEYNSRVVGCIEGYKRRFWYRFVKVRGTQEKPGRVATVIEDPDESVWGVAYEVTDDKQDQVKSYLVGVRELKTFKDAYLVSTVTFHPQDTSMEPVKAMCFLNNPQFHLYISGGESVEESAKVISTAVGPTGLRNDEYVFKLADFLRDDAKVEDKYIFELERLIKEEHASISE